MRTTLVVVASLLAPLADAPGAAAGAPPAAAASVQGVTDVAYRTGTAVSPYERERCRLDLYLPAERHGFATLVWFHGGGLTVGSRDDEGTAAIARSLAAGGLAVASAGYRLSPKVTYPAYVDDAATAVAWVRAHIAERGGDPAALFVGGHSAGAYLTLMLGLDPRPLRRLGLETSSVAGLIPFVGQTVTHTTIRKERGDAGAVVVDEAAPLFHVRPDAPPILDVVAEGDPLSRAANRHLIEVLQGAGHPQATCLEIPGRDHMSVVLEIAKVDDPARLAILAFVRDTLIARGLQTAAATIAAAAPPSSDLAAAEAAIRQADLDMAAVVAARDKARLLSFLASDVVGFRPGPIVGSEPFVANWADLFDASGTTLTWQPIAAEVFPAGTFGYTTGTFEWKGKDKAGAPLAVRGRYLTGWRKQASDGSWKAVLDIGAANP